MKALVCGSFDPVTNGHVDLIKRTAGMFEKVTVGIFLNSDKKYLFDSKKRLAMLKEAVRDIENVEVEICSGLVARYAQKKGIDAIIKGIRNSQDYEYELSMAKINKLIYPGAETLFLPATPDTENISSGFVKTLFYSGEDVSPFVPMCVAEAFRKLK